MLSEQMVIVGGREADARAAPTRRAQSWRGGVAIVSISFDGSSRSLEAWFSLLLVLQCGTLRDTPQLIKSIK